MIKIPKDKLFVQVPYEDLLNKLWLIALFKINCEIYIKPKMIDSFIEKDLDRIRKILDRNGILKTLHAPIYDPYEDGFEIFVESYSKSARLCKGIGIERIVMHVEYEAKHSPSQERWLKEVVPIWKDVAERAGRDGMTVLLENHNESSTEPIVEILKNISSTNLFACFDVGHFNAFGRKGIISYLDDYPKSSIREFHLSDNLGDGDTHLALGKGNVDFLKFFESLEERNIDAIYTIEAKNVWGIIGGMRYLKRIGVL